MAGRLLRFPVKPISSDEGIAAARTALAVPPAEREKRSFSLHLEEPEVLLGVCGILRAELETTPEEVAREAEFFYRFLEQPRRSIGILDEREFFLGETALIAGTACRVLSRREDARRWFDRSEAWFRHTVNSVADWARLSYQRLALRVEEREFEEVLELVPLLVESFEKLEMREDALKSRVLEGIVLVELDQPTRALEVFRRIRAGARAMGNDQLLATALTNLAQLHGALGEAEEALDASRHALLVWRRLNNRVGVGKIHWGIGDLLRVRGQVASAIEAYRSAQREFAQIGMRGDVAALHLVVADLLLDLGQDDAARREIVAALPAIDEIQMVPEGMAALALLTESIRGRGIDRAALRELHGYFDRSID
ncbi:MAG TPA: tetratricopeptide repeat protein [Thermoanaerobaculia bacterium]|nr:tetratricopeptide repeat protein [Thermoanaerobaculia bacterium]